MKKMLAASGAAFLLLAVVLFAPIVKVHGSTTPTNLFSILITGSDIESTTIGATSPSTGAFTSLSSSSGALNGSIGATTPNSGVFSSLSGPFNGTVGAGSPSTGAFTSITSTSLAGSGTNCVTANNSGALGIVAGCTNSPMQNLGTGTVTFASGTFSSSAVTYLHQTFTLSLTPPTGALVLVMPQTPLGDECQYTGFFVGSTLYIKVTHGAYNLPYTVPSTVFTWTVMK
jgi:hypothetical protein